MNPTKQEFSGSFGLGPSLDPDVDGLDCFGCGRHVMPTVDIVDLHEQEAAIVTCPRCGNEGVADPGWFR